MNEDPFSSSAEARLSGFFAWIKSNAISITLVLGLLIAAFFIYLYFQNKNEERLSEAFEAYQNIIESFNNAESTLDRWWRRAKSTKCSMMDASWYAPPSEIICGSYKAAGELGFTN